MIRVLALTLTLLTPGIALAQPQRIERNVARSKATLADAIAESGWKDGELVATQGRANAGDNGGSQYIFHQSGWSGLSSSQQAATGFFVRVGVTDKYLEAIDKSRIDIVKWGAVGDGTTDNTTIFETCIAASNALETPIFIPKGTFVTNSLFIPAKVSLLGESRSESVIQSTETQTYARWISLGHNQYGDTSAEPWTGTIDNLTFDASTAEYSAGTVTSSGTVVTLTGGTFPSWATSGSLLVVNNIGYYISTRDSDSQVTLTTSPSPAFSSDSFLLTDTIGEMVMVASFNGGAISNVDFQSNGKTTARLLAIGYNNANYLNGGGSTVKSELLVSGCSFYCNGWLSSESFGMGDGCKNVRICDNYIQGQRDDFGIHAACDRITVTGNTIESYDGRLLVGESSNITVSNNVLHYDDPSACGMGIFIFTESASADLTPPSNIAITGNTITYTENVPTGSTGYGIRIQSGRGITVSGNTLKSDCVGAQYGRISIEDQTLAGWVDPDGIDGNDDPNVRNLVISGNSFTGTVPGGINLVNTANEGPITIVGNSGGHLYDANTTQNAVVYSGNAFTNINFKQTSTQNLYPAFICEVDKSAANAATYSVMALPGGATEWTVPYPCRLMAANVYANAATTGLFQLQVYINGSPLAEVETISFNGSLYHHRTIPNSAGNAAYNLDAGDTLQFRLRSSNAIPTGPRSVRLEALVLPEQDGLTKDNIPQFHLGVSDSLSLYEKESDPANPPEGRSVIWQSDGTETGDDGDVIMKVTAASTTTTHYLTERAPLGFAQISIEDNATATTVASTQSDWSAKSQYTLFSTNFASSSNATPDHTNDHITLTSAGTWEVSCVVTLSGSVVSDLWELALWKNNGATQISTKQGVNIRGAGLTYEKQVTISGLVDASANDTIELWVQRTNGTGSITITNAVMTAKKVSD